MFLDLSAIRPNPDQPRKTFNAKELRELADSIHQNGLKQPITVRPMPDDTFQIVMGERRYRAHLLLQERGDLPEGKIPVQIRSMTNEQCAIDAILENLQRVDVTPFEEADAFGVMVNQHGMDPAELAKRLGVAPFRITWRLSLLSLAPEIRKLAESDNIDRQQALEISKLAKHSDQWKIVKLIQSGRINGWAAVKNAVQSLVDSEAQIDFFGSAPRASREDVESVNAMEAKIERMATIAALGWKDGECRIAVKVNPDRAALMADKLKAMRSAIAVMERDLRNASAQASAFMAA